MSSYVAPLVNAGISGALVYVPAYQLGYTAFQTSMIGFVARIIMSLIPGFTSFISQQPSSSAISITENMLVSLFPLGLMYFKFGISGVGIYLLISIIPALILLAIAGTIIAAGAQKKH